VGLRASYYNYLKRGWFLNTNDSSTLSLSSNISPFMLKTSESIFLESNRESNLESAGVTGYDDIYSAFAVII
jgi:hypothetical protein